MKKDTHYLILSRPEVEQLAYCLHLAEIKAQDFGYKKFFDQRNKNIKKQLNNILKIYELTNSLTT